MQPSRREFLPVLAGLRRGAPDGTAQAVTRPPKHHFFGYYGICPWNRSGRWLVCLESDFQDHLPGPEEAAGVGVVDTHTGEFRRVAETRAWNFQQGAMLHWNPRAAETELLYNDRHGDDIISVVLDAESGKWRELPRPINGISRDGRYGLCLTYGRFTRLRLVVGYVGTRDPNPDSPYPDNDGVFLMDLTTGESRLLVSIGEVFRRLVKRHPELRDRHMWYSPAGMPTAAQSVKAYSPATVIRLSPRTAAASRWTATAARAWRSSCGSVV